MDTNGASVIIADVGRLWMFIATGVVILLLALLYWVAYPETQYAHGYSEANFKKVKA